MIIFLDLFLHFYRQAVLDCLADNILFIRHVPGLPGRFMVTFIRIHLRKEYFGHLKHFAHAFNALDDDHFKRFLNLIPEIVNMFIKHVALLFPYRDFLRSIHLYLEVISSTYHLRPPVLNNAQKYSEHTSSGTPRPHWHPASFLEMYLHDIMMFLNLVKSGHFNN